MFNYRLPGGVELQYVTVSMVSELGPGQRKLVDVDGEPLVVFNIAGRTRGQATVTYVMTG